MSQSDQPSLLAKIRKLSARIVGTQAKFDLPKAHPDRYDTYGGAAVLQKARIERQGLQNQLDPIRLIATGLSCRDCRHFADVDAPLCWLEGSFGHSTKRQRANGGPCGPEALEYEPVVR